MLVPVALRVLRLFGLFRYWDEPALPAPVTRLAGEPEQDGLVSPVVGQQRRFGVLIDQVDGTTCGSAVLLALQTCGDPAEAEALAGIASDEFEQRFDAAQQRVKRQTNRCWPRALGTTPWGMVSWLRRHAPAMGRYRVRLVDATDPADMDRVLAGVSAALMAGYQVPLLVGSAVPRHWVLAMRAEDGQAWLVYEPSSGQVQRVELAAIRERRLAPLLWFDDLQAVLLPVAAR
jgi:hypothetical protein